MTTKLWGEACPREVVFARILQRPQILGAWNYGLPQTFDQQTSFTAAAAAVGNIGRFILEDEPELMVDELFWFMGIIGQWFTDLKDSSYHFFLFVDQERLRQQAKWTVNQDHSDERFLAILVEEFGEVADDILKGDLSHMLVEMVQAAAVACCWIEFRLSPEDVADTNLDCLKRVIQDGDLQTSRKAFNA